MLGGRGRDMDPLLSSSSLVRTIIGLSFLPGVFQGNDDREERDDLTHGRLSPRAALADDVGVDEAHMRKQGSGGGSHFPGRM